MKKGNSRLGEFGKGILTLLTVGFLVFLLALALTHWLLSVPLLQTVLSVAIGAGFVIGSIAAWSRPLRNWIYDNFYLPDLPF